jgi:hypothetical protein
VSRRLRNGRGYIPQGQNLIAFECSIYQEDAMKSSLTL